MARCVTLSIIYEVSQYTSSCETAPGVKNREDTVVMLFLIFPPCWPYVRSITHVCHYGVLEGTKHIR